MVLNFLICKWLDSSCRLPWLAPLQLHGVTTLIDDIEATVNNTKKLSLLFRIGDSIVDCHMHVRAIYTLYTVYWVISRVVGCIITSAAGKSDNTANNL